MQKERAVKVIKYICLLLVIGFAYAIFNMVTHIGIPCVFRLVTGYKCPGCGITHMCIALLQLDFVKAWQSNPAIFCMLPLAAIITLYSLYTYIKEGHMPNKRWYNVTIWLMVAILLVFGVVRNLEVPFLNVL